MLKLVFFCGNKVILELLHRFTCTRKKLVHSFEWDSVSFPTNARKRIFRIEVGYAIIHFVMLDKAGSEKNYWSRYLINLPCPFSQQSYYSQY